MTIAEAENFYNQDEQKYILNKNKKILNFINEKNKEGITIGLNIEQMQQIIDNIVLFFEFKYPNSFLHDLRYHSNDKNECFKTCQTISNQLDISQLKYHLHHDEVNFLECSYGNRVEITKEKKNLWDLTSLYVSINTNGEIDIHDLNKLKEFKFLDNIEGIYQASDLLGRFIESPIDVNYSNLTKAVNRHKAEIQLRNIILELIPLKLIYSNSTLPEYGYIRAKNFARMFSKEYNLKIDLNEVDEIMKRDYSSKQKKYCL